MPVGVLSGFAADSHVACGYEYGLSRKVTNGRRSKQKGGRKDEQMDTDGEGLLDAAHGVIGPK